jgi:hypothetical protein
MALSYHMFDESVYGADHIEHIRIGDQWLRTFPENADLAKALENELNILQIQGGKFLVRTFLYLAYSDLFKIPFTSDSARSVVVATVMNNEDNFFRSRLVKTLQETYEKYPSISANEPRRLVSPFAAIVFERCNGMRSKLVKEIQKIREELKPTRERLRELERNALWGSRTESIEAEEKIHKVLNEIVQHFGLRPGLFSWKRGISLAGESGDIIDNPTSWKAWLTGLVSLPVEIALRLSQRRPVAEIHNLQQALPGPRTLDKSLYELFGEIKSEKIRNKLLI